MHRLILIPIVVLAVLVGPTRAAHFTDTFASSPAAPDRKPFRWDAFFSGLEPNRTWRLADGTLEYKTEEAEGTGASVSFDTVGITVTDKTAWSLEVGFRHLAGSAARPAYETLGYLTWPANEPGRMRIVAVTYDAGRKAIVLINGDREEPPVACDLSGRVHAVRVTCCDGELRVYVDGRLTAGPLAMRGRVYSQPPGFFIGPITAGDPYTLQYRFDYFAFTDEGAFAPEDPGAWNPAADTQPVAEGLKPRPRVLDQPPYPGITVLRREKGPGVWDATIPDHWRRLREIVAGEPSRVERPYYVSKTGEPIRQNMYRNYQALEYDDTRCVAVSHSTKGIDDTGPGFMDYKLWYRISTDGGKTYDEERPMIQRGEGYSPMHPIEYVWVGKNSFCYASIPPFLKMTNGEILLPIYFAPLDEKGDYYNPVGAFTFTFAGAMIGKWNESGDDLIWRTSDEIRLDGDQSSRGANECAVVELSTPGQIFMVMRGSNAPNPKGTIPAVKWKTLSTDYGRTWSKCEHFTFDDDADFMSPSSCSSFIRSSTTGKVYWIGNISRVRPQGNRPRYPLIIAELDEEKLGLRLPTVTLIDDRAADDPPEVQFSNFSLVEDPATGQIVLALDRYMAAQHRQHPNCGRHTYVIEVK